MEASGPDDETIRGRGMWSGGWWEGTTAVKYCGEGARRPQEHPGHFFDSGSFDPEVPSRYLRFCKPKTAEVEANLVF